MAKLIAPFNAQQYDPTQGGGSSLPIGKHPVVVRESSLVAANSGNGGKVELKLEAIDGPAKGQSQTWNLNLYNNSLQASEIAHRQLSALCHVTNVFMLDDTQALHGIPFIVEIGLQKGAEAIEKGYVEVKKVYDMAGNEPGKAPQAGIQQPIQQQQPQQTAQQPAGGTPAWGGGNQQQQPQQNQQPAPTATWGNNQQQQAPAPTPAPAWGQNQNNGGQQQPTWGAPR